jgi:hypothetical protein
MNLLVFLNGCDGFDLMMGHSFLQCPIKIIDMDLELFNQGLFLTSQFCLCFPEHGFASHFLNFNGQLLKLFMRAGIIRQHPNCIKNGDSAQALYFPPDVDPSGQGFGGE